MIKAPLFVFLALVSSHPSAVLAEGIAEQTCYVDGTCTIDDSATKTEGPPCKDEHENCSFWASKGECDNNPGYMLHQCSKSCGLCEGQATKKVEEKKSTTVAPDDLEHGNDLGVPQALTSASFPVTEEAVRKNIVDARAYMKTVKMKKDLMDMCKNQHEECSIWAVYGECQKNPKYMKKSCAPACQTCDYLSIETRCPIDPNATNAWGPGDLNAMFTKLTSEPYLSKYSVEILSSPAADGPWVITMEDVVSQEEADRLIQLGAQEGYELSSDVGKMNPDGSYEKNFNNGRTSTNAWCQHDCYKDEMALDVVYRLSNLTDIEEPNSEYLQLLRYEEGQRYNIHHDYIFHQLERQQGVRILTLYLYLNDVEAGGGTNFDKLGITVMPKRGRALLWPSVHDENPDKKDFRTSHQALPVEKGVKYGANAWFHQRDFKTPNAEGCQ